MTENLDTLTPLHARRRRSGQRLTKEERKIAQDEFIKAMANTANVRASCLAAGISHDTVYQWQEHDTEFGIRFRQANQQANWLLFGEAWQRAMKGEERYVVSQGKLVMGTDGKPVTYREKSDRLLELMLKARLPEFRDKQQVEMTGKDGGALVIETHWGTSKVAATAAHANTRADGEDTDEA